ncbi:competence protein ComK [Bacillus sp. 1P06AnD]|uniref:competence protein ComK n=1 Tax=Bacillus sp. 1P06AnD TaxID=3132208 RepID=UPI0039A120BC
MTDYLELVLDEYEVNPYTIMLQPMIVEGKQSSHVTEVESEFAARGKPIDIIKKSCEYFGSDYEGRRRGTRHLTGYTHKAPIEIEKSFSIFMFPTSSPERDDCIWISSSHILRFSKNGPFETNVLFRNKKHICLPISFSVFESQVARTAILKSKLEQNVMETRRKYHYSEQEA